MSLLRCRALWNKRYDPLPAVAVRCQRKHFHRGPHRWRGDTDTGPQTVEWRGKQSSSLFIKP